MNVADKTIFITGAHRGIGRAMVHEALRRGANRVYAGTRSGEIAVADPRVTALTLDVTNPAQIREASGKIEALDVLVNNAGIAVYGNLGDLEVVQRHLDVNLFGVLRMTQAFLPQGQPVCDRLPVANGKAAGDEGQANEADHRNAGAGREIPLTGRSGQPGFRDPRRPPRTCARPGCSSDIDSRPRNAGT